MPEGRIARGQAEKPLHGPEWAHMLAHTARPTHRLCAEQIPLARRAIAAGRWLPPTLECARPRARCSPSHALPSQHVC